MSFPGVSCIIAWAWTSLLLPEQEGGKPVTAGKGRRVRAVLRHGYVSVCASLLKEEMAARSRILAEITPRSEQPDGLLPTGSQRLRHD